MNGLETRAYGKPSNFNLTTLLDLAKRRERKRDSESHARHSPSNNNT